MNGYSFSSLIFSDNYFPVYITLKEDKTLYAGIIHAGSVDNSAIESKEITDE
jgi:hypothetical protein